MTIQQLKNHLANLEDLKFLLPNGKSIPAHVHLTEVGLSTKNFIDCGGTSRKEEKASLQFWEGTDVQHRLTPQKFLKIVEHTAQKLNINNLEIEVEYQTRTKSLYGLLYNKGVFEFTNTNTACLALSTCGVVAKPKLKMSKLAVKSCC